MERLKRRAMFRTGLPISLFLVLGILSIFSIVGLRVVWENREYETVAVLEPFCGMQFVPESDFGTVSALGTEVVLWAFDHDDMPEGWLSILDEAQAQGIEVIAVLVPEGWSWDGTTWHIDEQAELFIQTVAEHPALFAVYSLEEPYWDEDEQDLGYTTAEQQLLYSAIKAIADVPIYSDVDSMAFWTAYSPETAFADGVCDYCGTGHYPCLSDGSYDRDGLIEWLSADLATIRERAPNSKLVWNMQAFAQAGTHRMPTADEMHDQAAIVYSMDVDGALWYCWWFGPLYSDFLSNHPELYPVVKEICEEYVLGKRHYVYLPLVLRNFQDPGIASTPGPSGTLTPTSTPSPTPTVIPTVTSTPSPTPAVAVLEPFCGMQFVPESDFGTVSALGTEVVLWAFDHDDMPEGWLSILDEAQAQGIEVIAVLVPEGWSWDGTTWHIDEQAELFIQTVAEHPALFAVYSLEEPYWDEDEQDLGYTTAEQQLLYSAIKAIADVPIYSDVDSMAFWTAYSPETAFADGVCDYCGTGHYPCLSDGSYDRDGLIEWLSADLATIRERAPNSKLVWNMQAFAQAGTHRMPTADEMHDQAAIVYSMDVDGALWYCWWFGPLYSDFLSNHPELYPVVKEIYEKYVLPAKP